MNASQVHVLALVSLEDLFQQLIRYLPSSQIMSVGFTDITDAGTASMAASELVECVTVTQASSRQKSNSDSTHVQLPEWLATVNNYYSVSKGFIVTSKSSQRTDTFHNTTIGPESISSKPNKGPGVGTLLT